MTRKVILSLKHYSVSIVDEAYEVLNTSTGVVEYFSDKLPTTISTADALDKTLQKMEEEFSLEF